MDDRSLPQLRLIIVPYVPRRPEPGECLQITWHWVGFSNQQVTLPNPKTRSAYSWVQNSKNSREFAYLLEFVWIYCQECSALWDVEISTVSVGKYRNAEYTHIHTWIIQKIYIITLGLNMSCPKSFTPPGTTGLLM